MKTSNLDIICSVLQESTLGLLLSIKYVNNLCNVSQIFKPVMSTDDVNFFVFTQKLKITFSYCQFQNRQSLKMVQHKQVIPK